MYRIIKSAMFAAVIVLLSTAASQAQAIPSGSYQQTCRNVYVDRDTLLASCMDAQRQWRDTRLDGFRRCSSEIGNQNGTLTCVMNNYGYGQGNYGQGNYGRGNNGEGNWNGRWLGRLPRGSYIETCRGVHVSGDDLMARCATEDGNWRDSRLDGYNQCRGDIANDNGRLRCYSNDYDDAGAGRYGNFRGPRGTYRQTCRDVRVDGDGDDLFATCQARNGKWRNARLDNFDACYGDIANDNGRLRCVPGSPYRGPGFGRGLPTGSYQQTCTDVHVSGDDLWARCQDRNGQWRDARLDEFYDCRADILNDNGRLRCNR